MYRNRYIEYLVLSEQTGDERENGCRARNQKLVRTDHPLLVCKRKAGHYCSRSVLPDLGLGLVAAELYTLQITDMNIREEVFGKKGMMST